MPDYGIDGTSGSFMISGQRFLARSENCFDFQLCISPAADEALPPQRVSTVYSG
jgi:hypothetical protein